MAEGEYQLQREGRRTLSMGGRVSSEQRLEGDLGDV